MTKIVRVNLVRRHPIALTLLALLLVSALDPLPALVDAATGAPATDAELVRPTVYTLLAPVSDVLDALTFLSVERAIGFLVAWAIALAAWGALRRGSAWQRLGRALLGPLALMAAGAAAAVLPRPAPRLVAADASKTVIDYHAHTATSHDGRSGWTIEALAAWHAAQGFQATYVTDHNAIFDREVEAPVRLLPGVEWSVHGQHVVAVGVASSLSRGVERFSRDTRPTRGLFGELHREGALGIASLPEYWRLWGELEDLVADGVDGFEIVNCAPKAIGFPAALRGQVLQVAAARDLLVVGASDNHGWGAVTCVWNLSSPSAHGYAANQVIARSVALAQGDWEPWTAAYTQPWLMLRALSWSERSSWITWTLVLLIYRAVPRRAGDPRGLGILARSLKLFKVRRPEPPP